jgi:signal transduction histidine kinase
MPAKARHPKHGHKNSIKACQPLLNAAAGMQGSEFQSVDCSAPLNRGSWCREGDHEHGVQFYSQDKFLIEELTAYVGGALAAGDAAISVCTEPHRESLLESLISSFSVSAIMKQGRLVVLDAQEMLGTFMVEDWPNEQRFKEVIGGVVAKAAAAAQAGHPRVAIFGEMVALLLAQGKPDAAIRLEQLWNSLSQTRSFSLFCAYPMSSFKKEADANLFQQVCNQHSAVIPTEAYMDLGGQEERLREVTQLQQKAKALETEVAEHKRLRQELELHVQSRTAELQGKNAQLLGEVKRRQDAETSLRTLTSQLMLIRDDERCRVARELHESTAQLLATLAMNLSALANKQSGAKSDDRKSDERKLLSQSAELVDNLLGEVRQLSHLLHPPMLDEMGLPSAVQWYADQFSKRTNITVTLEVCDHFGRLPREKEIAMFRVVQEALANVQEHSGCDTATIRLSHSAGHVSVHVSDLGCGISSNSDLTSTGVGISGMRERLRQLGGALTIHSNGRGTLVTADLPIA